jgi:hypothetical protein
MEPVLGGPRKPRFGTGQQSGSQQPGKSLPEHIRSCHLERRGAYRIQRWERAEECECLGLEKRRRHFEAGGQSRRMAS